MARVYGLLEVQNLNTSFKIDAGKVLAVNGVSFKLDKGKVLGIVGESGSGKSVTAYSIMGILDKNGKVDSGKIIYNGTDLLKLSEKEMEEIRGNKISIIFQDAMTALNPTWTIGNQIREAILTHAKDPVDEAVYPIENEIRSDKQRIAAMEKGIKNHPERTSLKEDLAFVKEKLIKDEENYKITKEKASKELKENEKAKDKEYKENVPSYNKEIKEAYKIYWKNFFKLNKKPTDDILLKDAHYKNFVTKIMALKENEEKASHYLDEAKKRYEEAKVEYKALPHNSKKKAKKTLESETASSEEKEQAKIYLVTANKYETCKNQYNGAKEALKVAEKETKHTTFKCKIYKIKFSFNYVHEPRNERYEKVKEAKTKKKNYYWECKSAYRETKYSADKKALQMLIEVGITEPEKRLKQYSFEMSGGMLQRCMIAMALVTKPDILIADEPTTALDVTIQAQILELLKKLQKEYGMGILIITHDLGVVAQICDEVDIMYAGRIVERGDVNDIFYHARHEYTRGLLKSMPKLDQPKGLLEPIEGNPVDLFCLPEGCAFSSRCKKCMNICIEKYPEEIDTIRLGHKVSCWELVKELHEKGIIDVTASPEGKPFIYNGAVIKNIINKKKLFARRVKEEIQKEETNDNSKDNIEKGEAKDVNEKEK